MKIRNLKIEDMEDKIQRVRKNKNKSSYLLKGMEKNLFSHNNNKKKNLNKTFKIDMEESLLRKNRKSSLILQK